MANRKPLTDREGEVRELSSEDFADVKSFDELPSKLRETLRSRGQRGPQKEPVKERITIRLDAEVVAHFRATGKGWQTRLNDALKKQIRQDKKRA